MRSRYIAFLFLLFCIPGISISQQPANATSATDIHLEDGTVLPSSGSVFVVQPDRASVAPAQLHALEIVSNSHAAGNYARAQIFAGPHASVELEGTAAATNFETDNLVFYVRLSVDDPEIMSSRVHLIHLQPNKKRRVVATYSQNVFGGSRKRSYDDVAVQKQQVSSGTWLKVTPDKPLAPGQYGIALMPQDPNLLPDDVYDFGVEAKR